MGDSVGSRYTKLILRIDREFNDPGLDYLQLLSGTLYSPKRAGDRDYLKAFRVRLNYSVALNNYWKYGLGRLRTIKLIEKIDRILKGEDCFSRVFSERIAWGNALREVLEGKSVIQGMFFDLEEIRSQVSKRYFPWRVFKVNPPYPTNNLFREMVLERLLPVHDWREGLPIVPFVESNLPSIVASGRALLTFELSEVKPFIVKTVVLISLMW